MAETNEDQLDNILNELKSPEQSAMGQVVEQTNETQSEDATVEQPQITGGEDVSTLIPGESVESDTSYDLPEGHGIDGLGSYETKFE